MDEHTALLKAQDWVNFPTQAQNKAGWGVRYFNGSNWIFESFTLAEDAWNFFYCKLSELKARVLGRSLQIQR